MTTAFITHPDCLKHEMGPQHPECPARLQAVYDAFTQSGLMAQLQRVDAPLASREQLAAAHAQHYVDEIFASVPQQNYFALDPDTSMNRYSLIAAQRASGAVVKGVEIVNVPR